MNLLWNKLTPKSSLLNIIKQKKQDEIREAKNQSTPGAKNKYLRDIRW